MQKGTRVEDNVLTTGASEKTKILNIYDFAGNEKEWTLEHCREKNSYGSATGARGGYWMRSGSDFPASGRWSSYVDSGGSCVRPCLI